MEKQRTTVMVGGREYTLVSSDSPDYVRRVAAYTDRRLRETALASRLPGAQAAALTALNLADELIKAQEENRRLRQRLRNLEAAAAAGTMETAAEEPPQTP